MALITNVNVGVFGNWGTNTTLPFAGTNVAKSYAYDEAQYLQTDSLCGQIGGQPSWLAGTSTANTGGSLASVSFAAFTNKQIRSVTVVPSVAETANDFIQLDLYSMQPQVFGTATGTLCYNVASLAANTPGFLGTIMGTGVNRVRICAITGNAGTGIGGATGTQAFGLGTAVAYNPTYVNLSGATATIIVVAPAGTNTQAGYVFPTGPQGGLSVSPGDVFVVTRGTSSIGVYQAEVECTFTPGGSVTR
jgi:hypothetical protein